MINIDTIKSFMSASGYRISGARVYRDEMSGGFKLVCVYSLPSEREAVTYVNNFITQYSGWYDNNNDVINAAIEAMMASRYITTR